MRLGVDGRRKRNDTLFPNITILGSVSYKCRNCGIIKDTKPSQFSKEHVTRFGAPKFCSKKCAAAAHRKGGTNIHGYRTMRIAGHPMADKGGRVLIHWLVMYKDNPTGAIIARSAGYQIHHKDGNRSNNVLTNLEYRLSGTHKGISVEEAIEFLEGLGYEIRRR